MSRPPESLSVSRMSFPACVRRRSSFFFCGLLKTANPSAVRIGEATTLESLMRSYFPSTRTGYFKTRRSCFSIPVYTVFPDGPIHPQAHEKGLDSRIRLTGDTLEAQVGFGTGPHGIRKKGRLRAGSGRKNPAKLPVLQFQRACHRRRTFSGALRVAHKQHIAK